MANEVSLKLGSAGAFPVTMVASVTSDMVSGLLEIPCGFMPSRVSIIFDGATEGLLEYISILPNQYLKINGAVSGLQGGALVAESPGGFTIDMGEEGQGTYYITAWR